MKVDLLRTFCLYTYYFFGGYCLVFQLLLLQRGLRVVCEEKKVAAVAAGEREKLGPGERVDKRKLKSNKSA